MKRVAFRNKPWAALFLLAPQLIIIFVFFLIPAFIGLRDAFFLSDPFGLSREFVWFENFVNIFRDPTYLYAIGISIFISLMVALTSMSISLLLASMAHSLIGAVGTLYKIILIIPYAIAPVIAGVLWKFLFDPSVGIVAYYLQKFGISWQPHTSATDAITLIIVAAAWKQISYNFLFFLAGLHYIPQSLIEAATMDRAKSWRRFWTITFPLLSPTIFFLLVTNMIYAFFEIFGIIDVTTRGGPEYSTATLVYRVYRDGFLGLDIGSSSAQSTILLILVIVLTIVQFRYIEKKVHY